MSLEGKTLLESEAYGQVIQGSSSLLGVAETGLEVSGLGGRCSRTAGMAHYNGGADRLAEVSATWTRPAGEGPN
jgi:hypothetical protein